MAKATRGNGRTIRNTVRVSMFGPMGISIRVSIKMTNARDMVL
jgi:hypothetical protein